MKNAQTSLSSFTTIPCTQETKQFLVDASIEFSDSISESDAQQLLVKKIKSKLSLRYAPSCFRKEFNSESPLCSGCLFNPQCTAV